MNALAALALILGAWAFYHQAAKWWFKNETVSRKDLDESETNNGNEQRVPLPPEAEEWLEDRLD